MPPYEQNKLKYFKQCFYRNSVQQLQQLTVTTSVRSAVFRPDPYAYDILT